MLSTSEPTREVKITYEQWLEYPLKVTADQAEIERFVDFDNPGLPVRDYRFQPKLTVMSQAEIAAGYQPTQLDLHYSGEFRAMDYGKLQCARFHDLNENMMDKLILFRLRQRFSENTARLPLSKIAYRRAIVQAIEVEVYRYPNRYDLWDGTESYLEWLSILLDSIEFRPHKYGDYRLKLFSEISIKLLAFCARRCGSNVMILSQVDAENLLNKLHNLDKMVVQQLTHSQPLWINASNDNPLNLSNERNLIKMKTKTTHRIRPIIVDSFGNFSAVQSPCEEEETIQLVAEPHRADNDLVSLEELAKRGQVYRVDDNGDYVQSLEQPGQPRPLAYIDGIDAFEQHPNHVATIVQPSEKNVINVNLNMAQGLQPLRSSQDSVIAGDSDLREFGSRLKKMQEDLNDWENEDDEDDDPDGYGDYQPESYYRNSGQSTGGKKRAKMLLEEHERILTKLGRVSPTKRKKITELMSDLRAIESELNEMEADGVNLPYHYRKLTMWFKITKRIRWAGKKLWKLVQENLEPIIAVVSIVGTLIGVGRRIFTATPSVA